MHLCACCLEYALLHRRQQNGVIGTKIVNPNVALKTAVCPNQEVDFGLRQYPWGWGMLSTANHALLMLDKAEGDGSTEKWV